MQNASTIAVPEASSLHIHARQRSYGDSLAPTAETISFSLRRYSVRVNGVEIASIPLAIGEALPSQSVVGLLTAGVDVHASCGATINGRQIGS